MPKLSLYRPVKSNDYSFFDRTISEMYTVGATDLYIHKYIGTNNPQNSQDLTLPHYDNVNPLNIQDLLFQENRDRKYDPSIYRLRGHYQVQNLDFDLSQFGLFLTSDIIFITVHYNDMMEVIGRKLMVGDVFELPHLTDYHPLNDTLPIGLRRYYQITDANYAGEGFSQTWYPHLWRVKAEPLVDSQEFKDILDQPVCQDRYLGDWSETQTYEPPYVVKFGDKLYQPVKPVPANISPPNPEFWAISDCQRLIDIASRYQEIIDINNAVIEEARRIVPKIGYDRSQLYVVPTYLNGEPAPPTNVINYNGAPLFGTGEITTISSSAFPRPSTVIRVPRNDVRGLQQLALNAGMDITVDSFDTWSLQPIHVSEALTDSGSGIVESSVILTATVLGDAVIGPYGTADNTYSNADQYRSLVISSLSIPARSTRIQLQTVPDDLNTGLLIRQTLNSENGTPNPVFPPNTTITDINRRTRIITVSSPTLAAIPAGTGLEVAYNFDGTVSQNMDYRADCDPRFRFIRRFHPRNFSYTQGYLTGDAEAPNGLPIQAGTQFPAGPQIGDYFLRIDYSPQKMYRFSGTRWIEISENVRTEAGFTKTDQSQLSQFINEDGRTPTAQGTTVPTRQSLSTALRVKPD